MLGKRMANHVFLTVYAQKSENANIEQIVQWESTLLEALKNLQASPTYEREGRRRGRRPRLGEWSS